MTNPMTVYNGTLCQDCEHGIEEGDKVYFCDDMKLCVNCASDGNYVCDCGNFKKPEFDGCYECVTK